MKNAISAGHKLTLEVGREILKFGGNAFDAATAAFFAMFIAEPCMASAGGNGFALTRTSGEQVKYFDFFSQTPGQKNIKNPEFYPIVVDFGDETEEFHIGIASAAVPGSIAGIMNIHDLYGTMPLKELIQPAVELAKKGVALDAFQAYDIFLLANILEKDPRGKEIFFEKGKIKKEGEQIYMPQIADFLDFLVDEGLRGFYEGEIAQTIVKDSEERGGFLTMDDFKNYRVNRIDPFNFRHRGKNVYVPNGANNGGLSLTLFLHFVNKEKILPPFAIEKAISLVKNPQAVWTFINKIHPSHNYSPENGPRSYKGTSHLNILDKKNNAVSLSCSIGEGSGYFIRGTDMQLNNMLGELYLLPGGAHSWKEGIRLQSMMTPTLLTDINGNIEFLAGSGGAGRIPFAIGQVIRNHLGKKMALQDSVDAPRYHYQNNKYQVEKGAEWNEGNESALLWDKKSLYFGGVHAISGLSGHIEAAGDQRRCGVAAVFD